MYGVYVGTAVPTTARNREVLALLFENEETDVLVGVAIAKTPASIPNAYEEHPQSDEEQHGQR